MSRAERVRQLLDRLLRSESDRLGADVAAIDASFGLLSVVEVEPDRADGARGAHLERIAESCSCRTLDVRHFPMFEGLAPPFAL